MLILFLNEKSIVDLWPLGKVRSQQGCSQNTVVALEELQPQQEVLCRSPGGPLQPSPRGGWAGGAPSQWPTLSSLQMTLPRQHPTPAAEDPQ